MQFKEFTSQLDLDLHKIASHLPIKKNRSLLQKSCSKDEQQSRISGQKSPSLSKFLFNRKIDRITNISQNLANGSVILYETNEYELEKIQPYKVSQDVKACDQEIKRLQGQNTNTFQNKYLRKQIYLTNTKSSKLVNEKKVSFVDQKPNLNESIFEQDSHVIQGRIRRVQSQNQGHFKKDTFMSLLKPFFIIQPQKNQSSEGSTSKFDHYLRVITKEQTPFINSEKLQPKFNPVQNKATQMEKSYLVQIQKVINQQEYGPYKKIAKQSIHLPKISSLKSLISSNLDIALDCLLQGERQRQISNQFQSSIIDNKKTFFEI